jgi:hypothetical protein
VSLFDELAAALKGQLHPGEGLDDFFTRVVHKQVLREQLWAPRNDWAQIKLVDEMVTVSAENWTNDDLRRLRPWHDRKKPVTPPHRPIVVFRGWGQELLIDGQNRVNLWLADGVPGPHRVLVVAPRKEHPNPFPGRPSPKAGG